MPNRPELAFSIRNTISLVGTFLTLAAAGCGGADGPTFELSPLAGTVTIDGAPGDGVSLVFLPDSGVPGNGGWAVTDDAGNFVAKQYSGDEGLPAGNYLVQFSRLRMPDGRAIPAESDAADVGAVESLPRHLSQPNRESSPYMVTIPGTQNADFDLSTRQLGRR